MPTRGGLQRRLFEHVLRQRVKRRLVYLIQGDKMQEKKQAGRAPRRERGKTEQPQILREPGKMGGLPNIDGLRVRVSDVVRYTRQDGDARIALPFLSEAQVRVALEYYEANKEEIDQEMAEDEVLAEQWRPAST